MNTEMNFQQVHSRNNSDWKFSIGPNGRLMLNSDGGVKQRCASVLKVMKDYKTRKPIQQTFIHAELKDMYTLADVVYALTKMEKINIVRKTNVGWALTAKGYRVIESARLEA